MKNIIIIFLLILAGVSQSFGSDNSMQKSSSPVREHLLMDWNWRFAYGHPFDVKQDYNHATGYFSYLTKAGYGDGPAAINFDDRLWRVLNLPHDWAVEQPFDGSASHSHGYKTVGPKFPESSVGWYRKSFAVPKSDLGKRISIQFDGVHRNTIVWVNGFYLGTELSGYSDFQYDISAYLNYGGDNMIAVRVDATIEEGWYYEGAGIYRHVWLNKTAPLHVAYNGTFVTSEVIDNAAKLTVQTTVKNEALQPETFELHQTVVDAAGKTIASQQTKGITLNAYENRELTSLIDVTSPILWSLETPYLYKLVTTILKDTVLVDRYETSFGIRTIRFDANLGFFLNGKPVKIKGTCNHQDHAGVGTAIPDALQEFRISRLKTMGSNAYRCSHNPPTPEMLNACDRLGMLVLCENRLMGTTPEILDRVRRMIVRDRNHPSVILWSLGNEEWGLETNDKGSRTSAEMQAFARQYDRSRPFTVASSGGWGQGSDIGMDVMGFNYNHKGVDEYHKNFPNQPSIATEESTIQGTRGVYEDDYAQGHMASNNAKKGGVPIEQGWQYYSERAFLSGLFLWTGFDYRGESNPLNFPAVSSQYGILDACGFPKEPYYYLKAWWGNEPVLHISPHWNWAGKEGQEISVWIQSNCDEVELFLNGISLSRKPMVAKSHLEWKVAYHSGVLLAKGYNSGKEIITDRVETSGKPATIELIADRPTIKADGEDVSVITVQVNDAKDRFVPTANQEVTFSLSGPGKIIGVGNGDPGCHEPDKYFEDVQQIFIKNGKIAVVDTTANQPELTTNFDDSAWPAYIATRDQMIFPQEKTIVVRGEFNLPNFSDSAKIALYAKSLAINQTIYINGHRVAGKIKRDDPNQIFSLPHNILKPGKNVYAIIGSPLYKRSQWEELNTDAGIIQVITPQPVWKRSVFNGLAQIMVQSAKQSGDITLTATSAGLTKAILKLKTEDVVLRPSVP